MNDLMTEVAVAESKGLLRKIDSIIYSAERNLAFDNLDELPRTIDTIRRLLNVIDDKVGILRNTNDDELY